jgi:hypothetical protein
LLGALDGVRPEVGRAESGDERSDLGRRETNIETDGGGPEPDIGFETADSAYRFGYLLEDSPMGEIATTTGGNPLGEHHEPLVTRSKGHTESKGTPSACQETLALVSQDGFGRRMPCRARRRDPFPDGRENFSRQSSRRIADARSGEAGGARRDGGHRPAVGRDHANQLERPHARIADRDDGGQIVEHGALFGRQAAASDPERQESGQAFATGQIARYGMTSEPIVAPLGMADACGQSGFV